MRALRGAPALDPALRAEDTMASVRLKRILMASAPRLRGGQQGAKCFSKGPAEVMGADDELPKKPVAAQFCWWAPCHARSVRLHTSVTPSQQLTEEHTHPLIEL